MVFWSLAIAVTAFACALLYYASSRRVVNAAAEAPEDATTAHFRRQLDEISQDVASGRMAPAEAEAAKAELARELLRHQQSGATAASAAGMQDRLAVPISLIGIAVLAFGIYTVIGNPGLPSQPLAQREPLAQASIDLDEAIQQIEARLQQVPDDLRGWTVIAPVYMEQGRFDDAVKAYRMINELGPRSADSETNLAEALILQQGGAMTQEAKDLLESAVKRDPDHVRSRFYLAGEMTRVGEYQQAVSAWNELIALATGGEPWLDTARSGLAAAEAGLAGGKPNSEIGSADQQEQIQGMVASLAARLNDQGGTVEEWTRLVRSYLVLEDRNSAQKAYDAARAAYPDAGARAELDGLAAEAGLN